MTEVPERLVRPRSEALDEILGMPFRVLDAGFVRVVDYMGTDESIVQAARVSYGAGTTRINEDRGLIRYLMRHQHTTPFEMCELKLHVRAPMDCWRQWIRHRTANVNEYSTRYSIAIDATQRTDPGQWRRQSTTNKQGSGELLDVVVGAELSQAEVTLHESAREVYEARLAAGVAREQARKDLPLSTYTEAYWKCDLHNIFHFLALRMDPHAQHEIREYATLIGEQIVRRWCPVAWDAFVDYRRDAQTLSRLEAAILAALVAGDHQAATAQAVNAGLVDSDGQARKRNRERDEIERKLTHFGLTAPWAGKAT